MDALLALALALLLLDLVGVVHVAPAAVEALHRLHDLHVELHVLGLLLADHDGVVQVEVDQGLDLLLRRLEKRVPDVAVDDVHLLLGFRADVPQAVGVRLERARLAPAAPAEGGHHPQAHQAVHAAVRQHQALLAHERRALRLLRLALRHRALQRAHLLHDVVGVLVVGRAVRHLAQERQVGELDVRGVRRVRRRRAGRGGGVEVDADERRARVLRHAHRLHRHDVEGHELAVDGQQHGLGVAVDGEHRVDRARHGNVRHALVRHEVRGRAALAASHLGVLRADQTRVRLAVLLVRERRLLAPARVLVGGAAVLAARLRVENDASRGDVGGARLRLLLLCLLLLLVVDLVRDVRQRLGDPRGEHLGRAAVRGNHRGVRDEHRVRAPLAPLLGILVGQAGDGQLDVVALAGAHLLHGAARLGAEHQTGLAELEADGGTDVLPELGDERGARVFGEAVGGFQRRLGGVVRRGEIGAVLERTQRGFLRGEHGGVHTLHRLGGVDHERARDVGAVLRVPRAERDGHHAVVELLVAGLRGHLELVLAAGLHDGGVADVHVVRLDVLQPELLRGVQDLILALLGELRVRHLGLLVHDALHAIHGPAHRFRRKPSRLLHQDELGVVLHRHRVGEAGRDLHHGEALGLDLRRGVRGERALRGFLGDHADERSVRDALHERIRLRLAVLPLGLVVHHHLDAGVGGDGLDDRLDELRLLAAGHDVQLSRLRDEDEGVREFVPEEPDLERHGLEVAQVILLVGSGAHEKRRGTAPHLRVGVPAGHQALQARRAHRGIDRGHGRAGRFAGPVAVGTSRSRVIQKRDIF